MKEEVKEICKSDMSNFISLHQESLYLQGARDLLLRLQHDFDMYLVPCEKLYSKTDVNRYEYFPVNNTSKRKIVGKGLLKALLSDRESLVRFLQGDYDSLQVTAVERDKKGKIKSLTIKVE